MMGFFLFFLLFVVLGIAVHPAWFIFAGIIGLVVLILEA